MELRRNNLLQLNMEMRRGAKRYQLKIREDFQIEDDERTREAEELCRITEDLKRIIRRIILSSDRPEIIQSSREHKEKEKVQVKRD